MKRLIAVIGILLIVGMSSCARKGTCPTYSENNIENNLKNA